MPFEQLLASSELDTCIISAVFDTIDKLPLQGGEIMKQIST